MDSGFFAPEMGLYDGRRGYLYQQVINSILVGQQTRARAHTPKGTFIR